MILSSKGTHSAASMSFIVFHVQVIKSMKRGVGCEGLLRAWLVDGSSFSQSAWENQCLELAESARGCDTVFFTTATAWHRIEREVCIPCAKCEANVLLSFEQRHVYVLI
jgi:hypothetical protein